MHWHRWAKWEVTQRGKIVNDGREIGTMVFQERVCAKCGYTQTACEKSFIYPGY